MSAQGPRVLRTRQSTGHEIFFIAGAVVVILGLVMGLVLFLPAARAVLDFAAVAKDAKTPLKHLEAPPPLTAAQQAALERFGLELARAVRLRDVNRLNLMLDDEALVSRVFAKLPDVLEPPGSRTHLINRLRRNVGAWLLELTGGEAEHLHTTVREGFPAVVLRTGRRPLGYADILVRPEGEGFKVVDGFNRLLAWTVSDEFCHALAGEVEAPDSAALARLPGVAAEAPAEVLKELPGLVRAVRLVRAADLLFYVDGLPPELDKEPLFFRQRLRALQPLVFSGTREEAREHTAACKAALRDAPGILGADCPAALALADLLRAENDLPAMEECLKRAEAAAGGDPHLKFLRADACLAMKRHGEALALLDEAERESARTVKTANLRLMVHLDRKDYRALVEELRAYKRSFGVTLGRQNYFEGPGGHEFLASPEFAAWEKENTMGG